MSGLEALGATASIAGILSLAGQGIKAAIALHGIYNDVATASESVRRLLQEINTLIRVLGEVQNLHREVELMKTPIGLPSLRILLEHCNKDIYDWLQVAERINPESSTGTKQLWKKFKTATRKTYLMDVREQMAAHCRIINLSLDILGRGLDIRNAGKLNHVGENVNRLSSTSHSLLHQIDSNSEKLEYLSSSSDSVHSLSVANSHRLEELSDGLDRVERILRSQSSMSSISISDHDEFYGPLQFVQGPPSEAVSDQEKDIEQLPTSLTVEEQNLIVSNVENRLSQCAYDFVAKYQLPIPAPPRQGLVRYPSDRKWAEWAHLLKRLTLKHHIPDHLLGNRRLELLPDLLDKSLHRDHQGAQNWPSRHQQSLPQHLDDWYILQIISSGIRVAQFLKDPAAMEHLVQLYRATMETTEKFNAEKDNNLIAEGSIEKEDGLDYEDDCTDFGDLTADIFDFLLLFGKRRIGEVDIKSLGRTLDKRDQINNWLLEFLLTSNAAATFHRSLLTDYDIIYDDEKLWARQVVDFWHLDDAGVHLNKERRDLLEILEGRGSSYDFSSDELRVKADIFRPISTYSESTEKASVFGFNAMDALVYSENDEMEEMLSRVRLKH